MNLQERLEAMLNERRVHVSVDPADGAAYRSKLLHEELGDWLIEACGGDGIGTPEFLRERDVWLVRIAGACLYLMHPEDPAKPALETVFGAPHPGLPSQDAPPAVREEHEADWLLVKAGEGPFSEFRCQGKWSDGAPCGSSVTTPMTTPSRGVHARTRSHPALAAQSVPRDRCPEVEQAIVIRRGDGTYKRKPRPDSV